MSDKNQPGGISSTDLIRPGDENYQNVLDTTEENPLAQPIELNTNYIPASGVQLEDIDHASYSKYIDRPFSYISDDVEDLRAYGQTTGEKALYAVPKFVTRVGTNVLGSTVGLVYGGGAFLEGLFDGPEGVNATKAFFDNDFQRSMDGINDWMDGALPHYYTKEENDYNFFQSMGTANFWANDFSQGLSFVVGAVLSETLTAGLASSAIVAKAGNLFHKMSKGTKIAKNAKHLLAGATNKEGLTAAQGLLAKQRLKNMALTLRQLGTGAMYESGVEARHHYDTTLKNLEESFNSEYGRDPSQEEMAYLVDIATKSSNAVFAANVALVGYGNYMMFPKIFGKGFNGTKKAFKGKIGIDDAGTSYKALYKDVGKKRAFAQNALRALKVPAYEGFVEEGGQKLADLSGQEAAEYYFNSKKDPTYLGMVGELLNHTNNAFGEAYGSKEGQKEIGIGFLLAALGLPGSGAKTDKQGKAIKDKVTGKIKTGFKWQGGIYGTIQDQKFEKKMLDAHVEKMNKDSSAIEALNNARDAAVASGVAQDKADFATMINSPFVYKNAEFDNIFNFINTRLKAGFEQDIYTQIENIRNMTTSEFREAFKWGEVQDLNDAEIKQKQSDVADMMEDRVTDIKETMGKVNSSFTNYSDEVKDSIVHALATGKDMDTRESSINDRIKEILGVEPEVEQEVESRSIKDEREEISLKQRIKRLWERFSPTQKKKILALPESKTIMRKLGITSFTDPTHIEELVLELMTKRKTIYDEIMALEADPIEPKQAVYKDGKNIGGNEEQQKKWARLENLRAEYDKINEKTEALTTAINEGLDPDLSASEQKLLDDFKKRDKTSFNENKEELISLLKDSRKIRARRHRMLTMVNDLMDYRDRVKQPGNWYDPSVISGIKRAVPGKKVPLPKMLSPKIISNKAAENAEGIEDLNLKRLFTKYQGKVIEFEYTRLNKTTKEGLLQIAKEAGMEEKVINDAQKIRDNNSETDEITALGIALKALGIAINDGPQTGTYRFYVRPGKPASDQDNFLIAFPTKENIDLIIERRELEKLENNEIAKKRIKEIDALLGGQGKITEFQARNLSFLKSANNIREVGAPAQIKEIIESSTEAAQAELQNEMQILDEKIAAFTEHAEKLALEVIEAESLRVKSRAKKELALKVYNLTEEHSNTYEKLQGLEVEKVKLTAKLNEVNELVKKVQEAEKEVESLDNLSPNDRQNAVAQAVSAKIQEYIKEKWVSDKEILEQHVDKGFFKDVDLLSELFQTEEDRTKNIELAQVVYDFVQNLSELPEELVYLLDEGVADLKYRYESSFPLLTKLKAAIHFRKDGVTYDGRFSGKDEQARRNQFESIVTEVHELKIKYDSAVENLRSKLKLEMSPLFEEANKQHGIIDKITVVNDLFVENFNAVNSLITQLTTSAPDVLLDSEPRTSEGQMTDEELERDIELNQGAYYKSPSITQVKLAKTAGDHYTAEVKFKELSQLKTLTKIQKEQLEAYRSQLVFFEWTAMSNNDKTDIRYKNYKLVTLTRKSIVEFDSQQVKAEDKVSNKVGFYDYGKAKKDSPRYSKVSDEEGNLSKFGEKENSDESKEDIILLVVDDKGRPVKHNGRIVYTSLMGTETYRTHYDTEGSPHKVYRYGKADLIKVNGSVPSFTVGNKIFYTGQMTAEAKAILEQHKSWRQKIIDQEEFLYLNISGKSHGMQIYGEGGPTHKAMARNTIVQKESDVKDIELSVGSNKETGKVGINMRSYSVKAGFLYANKNGNLIRFKINTLPPNVQANVYNMLRLLATQVEDSKLQNASFTPKTAYMFPNVEKSIVKQLSDLIYFGKHSKARANKQYSIYTEGDVLYFGGQSMTFAQLKNADGHPEMHAEFKDFLKNLHIQVNSRNLKNTKLSKGPLGDQTVRENNNKDIQTWYEKQKSANKKIREARKKFTQKKGQTDKSYNSFIQNKAKLTAEEKAAYKSSKPSPQYTQYNEIVVDGNLNVTQVTWDNYTHFLMGTKPKNGPERSVHEIPVTVNMLPDTHSKTKDNHSYKDNQFRNIYLTFSPKVKDMNFEDLKDPTSDPKFSRADLNKLDLEATEEETTNDELIEGKAPSGIIEGKQYIFTNPTNGVKVKFVVEEVDHDNFTVQHRVTALYKKDGTLIDGVSQWTAEMESEMGQYFYLEKNAKDLSRAEIKQETLEKEEAKKKEQNHQDLKDLLDPGESKPTSGEDIDGASFAATSLVSMQEDFQLMDLHAEYEKFKGMVPKDVNGNPIFDVNIVEGLIHGTDFGYFTRTGEILLSTEAVRGTIYHETFHGISYKLLSKEERQELYNEVRGIRGKATTYKGELKNLKSFTNIEADEWLAEEFRQYALNEGNYKVGSRVQKSLIQKLFDFLFKFFSNLNQTKLLFDRIHSGYYNNAVEEYTTYDIAEALEGRQGASMGKHRINTGARRDLNSGMTVALFDIIHQSLDFGIEDLFAMKNNPEELAKKLAKFYGVPGSKNTAHSRLVEQVTVKWNAVREGIILPAIDAYNITGDEKHLEVIKKAKKEQTNLDSIITVLNEEWDILIDRNLAYLKQFKLNLDVQTLSEILENEIDQNALTKDTLGTRAWALNEINLKTTVRPGIKLLLGTLPKGYTNENGDPLIKDNKSGVYQLATFSEVVNTLYKQLANTNDIDDMFDVLSELARENRTYKVLLKRLGIEEGLEAVEELNFNQFKMLMGFIKTFNTSAEEYVTLLAKQSNAKTHPGRFFRDSNTEKAEDITRTKWNYIFKDRLRNTKYGKVLSDGRLVLDVNKKITIGNRSETFKTWATSNLDIKDIFPLLEFLGIEFTNMNKILNFYEQGKLEGFIENVNWILGEVLKNEGDVSSIFGGEVEGNLKSLLGYELQTTTLAITLQHTNPKNKQIFGITRKSYINILADKLNASEKEIVRLMETSPLMYGSLYNKEKILRIRTLEGGKDIHRGKGHDISQTTEGNIAAAHITSILEGFVPLIRTGNKKMEKSIQIGENRHRTDKEMVSYLTDLLKAEILTANEIKNNTTIQQIPELKKAGISLQFFKDSTKFPTMVTGANVFIHTKKLMQDDKKLNDFIQSDVVQKEIQAFLAERQKEAFEVLKEFGFISSGKKGYWNNIGIDGVHITDAYDVLADKEKLKAIAINGKLTTNVVTSLANKIANTQLIGIIEQARLFLGHPALYKDVFKRTSGMVGVKTYPVVNTSILEAMNNKLVSSSVSTTGVKTLHSHRNYVRMVTRKEITKKSAYVEKYVKRLLEMGRPDVAATVNKTFSNMDIFDGGGFISLDFYRSVLFLTDNWTTKHETAYQKIVRGIDIGSDEIAFFPPLKPQVFTDAMVGGMNIKLFNKFALYPIHPNLSKLSSLKGERTVMDDIYDDMLVNDIDYMVFESSTKVGAKTNSKFEFEPLFDIEGNVVPLSEDLSYIQEYPLEYFGIQLDPSNKNVKDVRIGTQSATMLFMNVFENGLINNQDYSEEFKGLDKKYHSIHTAMIEKDKTKLAIKLGFKQTDKGFEITPGNKEAMRVAVLDEMNKRDIPEHMKDTVNELFSEENELSYTNLIASKQKIDDLLYSIVTNTVVSRKINGKMSVLQADVGFTIKAKKQGEVDLPGYRELKFYDFEKDGKTVTAMEIYLPHHLREAYGTDIDINDLTEAAKEMIGFRIPTEGLNSVEFIKVAGFLPHTMGDTVIVPHEMVAKSGADYDIDKLTIYLPHITRREDGMIDLVPRTTSPAELYKRDKSAFRTAVTMLFGTNTEGLRDFFKEFDSLELKWAEDTEIRSGMLDGLLDLGWDELNVVYTQPTTVVQNMLMDSMKNILRHPASFPQLISPVGAFELSDIAHEVHDAQVAAKIIGITKEPGTLLDKFGIRSLIKTTYQMHQTLGGTGIVASSVTDQAKSQRSGFRFKLESVERDVWGEEVGQKETYKLNFEGLENQQISLGKVFDTTGNYINMSMQQYITAYVDGEKDPFAMYVNAGLAGANVHMLLIRAGVPLKTVLKFMAQPVIHEYFRLKNLQSIANDTSPYKQPLSEREIKGTINKLVGTPTGIAMLNEESLDKHDIVNGKKERSSTSMLVTNLRDMSKGQKSLQAQVFADFLRYKEYAELTRKAQQLAAFDTSRLKNGYNLIYLTALENYIKRKDVFEGLDAKTGPTTELEELNLPEELQGNYPFLTSLKKMYKQAPQLFQRNDLKESVKFTDGAVEVNPVKDQMISMAEQMIKEGKSQDEIIYNIRAFDNFVTSWVWQTRTGKDQIVLNTQIKSLFQGKDSLPNQASKLKNTYGDNILIQDLTPTLQEFTTESHYEHSIDKLQLFSKKYSPDEIDDLADAWYELYHMGGRAQRFAEDLLSFSILKSGTDFHPSSFFHALPGVAILEKTTPMMEAVHDAIHNVSKGRELLNHSAVSRIYEDFLDNSWDNNRITPTRYSNKSIYKSEAFYTKDFNTDRIVILSVRERGEQKGIVTLQDKYFAVYFRLESFDEEKGQALYIRQPKKGILGHLKEIGVSKSVIESNNYPFGRQSVSIPLKVIKKIKSDKQSIINFKYDINDTKLVNPGVLLVQGMSLDASRVMITNLKDLFTKNNYAIFDVLNKKELQLKLAKMSGFKNWGEFAKDPYNKGFMTKNEYRQFFEVEILEDVGQAPTTDKTDSTEQPVTQNLQSLKDAYNKDQCE